MARTQQAMSLVLDRSTAAALYASSSARVRERRIPLSPEVLDLLPGAARRAIRAALSRGGVEAFLLSDDDESTVTVVIRNRRRR